MVKHRSYGKPVCDFGVGFDETVEFRGFGGRERAVEISVDELVGRGLHEMGSGELSMQDRSCSRMRWRDFATVLGVMLSSAAMAAGFMSWA